MHASRVYKMAQPGATQSKEATTDGI